MLGLEAHLQIICETIRTSSGHSVMIKMSSPRNTVYLVDQLEQLQMPPQWENGFVAWVTAGPIAGMLYTIFVLFWAFKVDASPWFAM